jgi:hypothetical protein
MSSITRIPVSVKPTRRTTILFDATQRHPAPRTFGRGLLAARPTFTRSWTDEDAAWAAQAFAPSAYDLHLEERAQEAAWTDSYCRGVLPL